MNEAAGPKQIRHSVVGASGHESKADTAKNSGAQEPGTLGPWIKENGRGQAEDGKNKHRHPGDQLTKMDGNGWT